MSQISSVPRETAIKAFGTVWLADDFGGARLTEHLGTRKPALHFGETFLDLESALAARPGHEVVYLADRISLPNITPVPLPRQERSGSSIPREVYIVEFDNLLERGLRVCVAQIASVEFEYPPAHLMGKIDFVVGAVVAGPQDKYRILVEYDQNFGLNIVENPMVWDGRGSYVASGQVMAFFRAEDAAREADRFAEGLVKAANWRARSGPIAA
ncbi:hypothetical protein OIU34_18265 [Pararhizobium sp. BT-229]|uniref:hypothetical protein n=1 Tax=Pararhizobium sp. BT-229 TaxID=2986923 RepID=UPI0021F70B1C|nr:hypothetical protein [Pararhizobium sp. BT-229]MCV9963825.1 hypothetical protein [Pararhizobium sp. BT-229]